MVSAQGVEKSARSPSPPPNVPVSQQPGPRAQKLNDVFTRALSHTISTCSYAHFASCFPTADKYNKPLLESVWRQVTNMIETRSRREFDEIFAEKDVIRGLNELDRVINEAEERKKNGDEPMPNALHDITPEQLFLSHLTPQLNTLSSTLDNQMALLQSENEQLIQSIRMQEQEIDAIVQSLESTISDLEGSDVVLQDATKDGAIRTDARELDNEIYRSKAGQASRL